MQTPIQNVRRHGQQSVRFASTQFQQSPATPLAGVRAASPSSPAAQTPSANGANSQPSVTAKEAMHKLLADTSLVVETQLARDLQYPLLDNVFERITGSDRYMPTATPDTSVLAQLDQVDLPVDIFAQYDLLQCRCFLGVFPEISRVWMTVDHRLFLWNYENPSDFYAYEEQDQIIVNVALVRPKPSVFVDHVRHVIVVATPAEVFLLCASVDGPSAGGDLALYSTQFVVPADGINFVSIVGTAQGRIFMGGNDGNIYEFQYQAQAGWFTSQYSKVNLTANQISRAIGNLFGTQDSIRQLVVDNERNLLYSVTKSSVLTVYDLGPDGTAFTRIAQISNLQEKIQGMQTGMSTLHDSVRKPIQSIHVIPRAESRKVTLVAITQGAARIYFTVFPQQFANNYSQQAEILVANDLRPVHVRLPPFAALRNHLTALGGSDVGGPSSIAHTSLYSNGVTISAVALSDQHDALISTAPDAIQLHSQFLNGNQQISDLHENVGLVTVVGKSWSIAELPPKIHPIQRKQEPISFNPNELVSQANGVFRRFIVATSSGVFIYTKQRPIDRLCSILANDFIQDQLPSQQRMSSDQALTEFIELHGATQTCAMLLEIICTPDAFGQHLMAAAKDTFFSIPGHARFIPESSSFSHQYSMMGRHHQHQNEEPGFHGGPRHDGIALFIARQISQVWDSKVFKNVADANSTVGNGLRGVAAASSVCDLAIPTGLLRSIKLKLGLLQAFLSENDQFIQKSLARVVSEYERVEQVNSDIKGAIIEQRSLFGLWTCLQKLTGAISFLLFSDDLGLPRISPLLSYDDRDVMLHIPFFKFVLTEPSDRINSPVSSIVAAMIRGSSAGSQGLSSEAVSKQLEIICGGFCDLHDFTYYRANECLARADALPANADPSERRDLLHQAHRLFLTIPDRITLKDAASIGAILARYTLHLEAVKVVLTCGAVHSDMELRQLFSDLALMLIASIDPEAFNQQHFEPLPAIKELGVFNESEGFHTPTVPGLTPRDYLINTLNNALSLEDEVFQEHVCNYLTDSSILELMLSLQHPCIRSYLESSWNEPTLPRMEMLWRLYIRDDLLEQAAHVQLHIAQNEQYSINLQKRLEYISHAVGNFRGASHLVSIRQQQQHQSTADGRHGIYPNTPAAVRATSTAGSGNNLYVSLREAEELLEVGQIQLAVVKRLQRYSGVNSAKITRAQQEMLNNKLLDLTALYNDYADVLDMSDILLRIIKCSNNNDAETQDIVIELWKTIVTDQLKRGEHDGRAMEYVNGTVIELGKQLYPSELAFPVPHLLQYLETCTLRNATGSSMPEGWVVVAFAKIGVDMNTTFEALNGLITSPPQPIAQNKGGRAFILKELITHINIWLNNYKHSSSTTAATGAGAGRSQGAYDREDSMSLPPVTPARPKVAGGFSKFGTPFRGPYGTFVPSTPSAFGATPSAGVSASVVIPERFGDVGFFPARQVDDAINRYILSLHIADDREIKEELKRLQSIIHQSF
ncbi:nucleoporin-domain-containing protein [Ramicandelaber brevisporus]|nr:nucleoporin-domain-containing protein [Ramicandelaber brevisporus]